MKYLFKAILALTIATNCWGNQTATLTPILPESELPFTIEIEEASFSLPVGLQSYASASYKGKWVLLAGRTNGLHGFANVGNNFPPQFQNTTVFVVNPTTGVTKSRSFVGSGLSQEKIDSLSVVASQSCQNQTKLFIVGGYGINTATGQMETKSTFTRIDLKKLISWVETGAPDIEDAIEQASHDFIKVTGGALFQNSSHDPFLLILGQNFQGDYTDDSNGDYTRQIRSFWVRDVNGELHVTPHYKDDINPDYRRRDLPVGAILHRNEAAYVAFGGVFTLDDDGVWTVPIVIKPHGSSSQADPNKPDTFKQGMNQYDCPKVGLYSTKHQNMYMILPGGLSYGYYDSGNFVTSDMIPFINQVTTIKINRNYVFSQYIMTNEYPEIISQVVNPGNPFLFGAEAEFFVAEDIATFRNEVIQLDKLKKPTVIGYIVGGIMSTLPNTNTMADSTSSPYIFAVRLIPKS
jgi:hypothetical protein